MNTEKAREQIIRDKQKQKTKEYIGAGGFIALALGFVSLIFVA